VAYNISTDKKKRDWGLDAEEIAHYVGRACRGRGTADARWAKQSSLVCAI